MATRVKPEETLTPREFEILCLIADGLRVKEIAQRIGISYDFARQQAKGAYDKVGADNIVGAAMWFARRYPTRREQMAGYDAAWDRFIDRHMALALGKGRYVLDFSDVEAEGPGGG